MSKTNITMLSFGRPRLFEQALRTLQQHTAPESYRLTLFNDDAKLGTGTARNEVIRLAEKEEGRLDYLYLSDLDVAFTEDWLEMLIAWYDFSRTHFKIGALGGYCHPYHQPFEKHALLTQKNGKFNRSEIGITWALPTQSMLMTWDIWDKYGPFDTTTPGAVNCGEDWLFTERLRKDGLRVGTVYPPVVLNTGRRDSFGKLMIGHELVEDIPGLIVE